MNTFQVRHANGLRLMTPLLALAAVVSYASSSAAEARNDGSGLRVEVETHAGGAFPREGEGLRPGPTVGLALLFRPSSAWAIGPVYDHYVFDWHARAREFDDPAGSASLQVFGLANRLYLLEGGRFEPQIQVMLGWARVKSSDKSEQCDDADGLFSELSVGFDVYATDWFRLAPSLFAATGLLRFGGCNDMYVPNDPPPEPSTGMLVGLRFGGTLVFGDRGWM